MLATVLKGMLISFALVSSIGMQNIFVFNNAMTHRLHKALLITVFIWIADTALTSVAFLGMGALIGKYLILKQIIMAVGGLIVIWMGYGILRSANQMGLGNDDQEMTLTQAFKGAWIVTFANPQAIIDTGISLGAFRSTLSEWQALPFLGGIILATAIWFFGITLIVGSLKNRLPRKLLMWINIISGAIVMIYGVNLIITAIRLFIH